MTAVISKYVTKLDILGKEIQFKIENSETYKTWVGGFFTILLGFISLGSIYLFGNDVIFKTKPTLLFKKNQLADYPTIGINNSNFFYSFRLVDSYGVYIEDLKYFEPLLTFENMMMNFTSLELETTFLDVQTMETCNTTHIDNKTLYEEGLRSYKCAVLDKFKIGGNWDGNEVNVLTYTIKRCNSETERKHNIVCAPDSEIMDNFLFPINVEIKYQNQILDATRLTDPVSRVLDFRGTSIDLTSTKKNLFYYSGAKLTTDLGYLVEDLSYDNFTQIEKIDVDSNLITESNIYFADIYLTKLQLDYNRSYLKVQDVAATVGGFFSIVFYALKVIYYFYVENSLQYFYFQHLFDFYIYDSGSSISAENKKEEDPKEQGESVINIIPFQTHNDNQESELISNKNMSKTNQMVVNMENLNTYNKSAINDSDKNIMKEGMEGSKRSSAKKNSENSSPAKLWLDRSKMTTLISHMTKPKIAVDISERSVWNYKFCLCFIKKDSKGNAKIINQLIYAATVEVDKRTSTLGILSLFEQFKVLKKVVLNENQCYMLDNKGKKPITNQEIPSLKEFTEAFEERNRSKEEKLILYLKDKKLESGIVEVDYLLFKLMNEDLQKRINKQVKIN